MAYTGIIQSTITYNGFDTLTNAIMNVDTHNVLTFRVGIGVNDPYNISEGVNHPSLPIDLSSAGIGIVGGYIPITTITKISNDTIRFQCYIPSGAGTAFTCNELVLYNDPNPLSVDGDEKSFIYLVFPDIVKNDTTGLYFDILLTVDTPSTPSTQLAVTTEAVTGISASGTDIYATFNGTIVSLGATDPTQHGFVYGENPAPELNPPDSDSYDTNQGAVSVVGPYTSTDTGGLLLNNTYYVRAYAVDVDSGRVYGNEVTFDTPDCTEAYNDGYDNGYNAGCEDGDDDLYGESGCGGDYSQGWQDGHDDRTMEIYDEGYDSFVDCVTPISNPYDGCPNGWDTEFEDGFNNARSDNGC